MSNRVKPRDPSTHRKLKKISFPYRSYCKRKKDREMQLVDGEGKTHTFMTSEIYQLVTSHEYVSKLKSNTTVIRNYLSGIFKISLQKFDRVVCCLLVTKREKTLQTAELKMLLLFKELLDKFSMDEIAEKLGIHVGTIKRWKELNSVPTHYFYDFNRLLGRDVGSENVSGDNTKDKDQYFTKTEVAEYCRNKFNEVCEELGIDLSDYWWIEPSVGHGEFYKLMPTNRRIGIDIDPNPETQLRGWSIIKHDFLTWTPDTNHKYVMLGNPPFGLRGHTALQFINHAEKFADIIAFILPPLFDSDGKGVPKKRVKGYVLAHTEKLDPKSFVYPDGREVEVNTIFQVWTKVCKDNVKLKSRLTCKTFIEIFSLSDGGKPSNTRNKDKLGCCDVYLPSTCFEGMKAYNSFAELPNKRGYGIIVKEGLNKDRILSLLRETDWTTVAFKSTNSAVNLRSSLIEDVVTKAGYFDN